MKYKVHSAVEAGIIRAHSSVHKANLFDSEETFLPRYHQNPQMPPGMGTKLAMILTTSPILPARLKPPNESASEY